MEENKLVRYKGGLVQHVGNAINVTNKLLKDFKTPLKTSVISGNVKFVGNNEKHIVVLLKDISNEYIADTTIEFINMILKACKLKLDHVAILNLLKEKIEFEKIMKLFSPNVILLFDIKDTDIRFPFNLRLNQSYIYGESKFLLAPSLHSLFEIPNTTEAKLKKRELWKGLKNVFDL